jgi:hypothetical protein
MVVSYRVSGDPTHNLKVAAVVDKVIGEQARRLSRVAPDVQPFRRIVCQDAATHARQGGRIWEMILAGDGGGTIFQ